MPVKRRNTLRRRNPSKKRRPSKKKKIKRTRNVNKRNLSGGAMIPYDTNGYPNPYFPVYSTTTPRRIPGDGGLTTQQETILYPSSEQNFFKLPFGATTADPGPDFSEQLESNEIYKLLEAKIEEIEEQIRKLEALKKDKAREISESKHKIKLEREKIHGNRNEKYKTKK